MPKINLIPLLQVIVVSLILFALHSLCFYLLGWSNREFIFHHSLVFLYTFFASCAAVIIMILIFVKQKNLDNVGYTFLVLTTIKMGLAYFVLRPILKSGSEIVAFEKGNFFIIFAIFLALETIITIRILNKV